MRCSFGGKGYLGGSLFDGLGLGILVSCLSSFFFKGFLPRDALLPCHRALFVWFTG